MSTLRELEAGLLIDENALDEAIAEQAHVFFEVSKQLALLISQRDAAKQLLEDEEAMIDTELRAKAGKIDAKLTENEIKAQARLHPSVKKAREQFLKLSAEAGQYHALEASFVQRSYALGHLVNLFTAGYFGDVVQKVTDRNMKDVNHQDVRKEMNELRRRREVSEDRVDPETGEVKGRIRWRSEKDESKRSVAQHNEDRVERIKRSR